jgi:hypothetical protein
MGKISVIIICFFSFIAFFSCEKEFKNPYDRDCPPETWTPINLIAEISINKVILSWEQTENHFDGYMLEKSTDSLKWKSINSEIIKTIAREYIDSNTIFLPGSTLYYRIYAKADKNKSDYCYSNTIKIPAVLPTVLTDSISSYVKDTVTLNGEVTSDGGSPITERGFCYATTPAPDINDIKVTSGTGTGEFNKLISDLQPVTTYYVRAYAINATGTTYGNEQTFTTTVNIADVITYSVTNNVNNSAVLSGEVTSDGGSPVMERGFCYATTPSPDVNDTKVISGNGTGTFNYAIYNLQPYTTYYVRAYAINAQGTAYGNEITFTNLCDLPISPGIISGNNTILENTTDEVFSISSIPGAINYNWIVPSGATIVSGQGTPSITVNFDNSSGNVGVRAENACGNSEYTNLAITIYQLPVVITNNVTNITYNAATLNGYVVSDGGLTVTERGFCYDTSPNPDITDTKIVSGAGIGVFANTITGLRPFTTYYVRAYATNKIGTFYGEEKSFIITCELFILEGLVAYYPFNGNANDESGNGNNGIIKGAKLTNNRFGNANNAFYFDGSTSYIEVPSSNSLNLTGDKTISVWVSIDAQNENKNYPTILNKRVTSDTYYPTYCIQLLGPIYGSDAKKIDFFFGKYDSNYQARTKTLYTDYINKWINIIATYSQSDGFMKVYINGTLDKTINVGNITSNMDNNIPLTMGKAYNGSSQTYYKGAIDDIRIYNRALTECEILVLYNEMKIK